MDRERLYRSKDHRKIGWILVIVLLTAALITMSVLFAIAKIGQMDSVREYRALAESTYSKSYYALVYNIDGLETATEKLSVASGKATRQEYLADITSYATAAAENMSNFSSEETGDSKILKFINQSGDFAKYLDDKLNKGGSISDQDRETIAEISSSVREIKRTLAELGNEVQRGDFSFVDALKERDSLFSATLRAFDDKEVAYPSMIYDGPFSDALNDKEPKALSKERVDEVDAEEVAARVLKEVGTTNILVKEGSKNIFETYDVEADTAKGRAYITIAKQGGMPVSFSLPEATSQSVAITAAEAESFAERYVQDVGILSMKAVWASLYDKVYYINLAAYEEGVILYPDLVKVKVSAEDGSIVGMDCLNYIYNHTARIIGAPTVTEHEASEAISEYLVVSSCRLTLIPAKGEGEILAYEFFGTKGDASGDKYFVYVDAQTGEELKIMRVLDGERGLLLQ